MDNFMAIARHLKLVSLSLSCLYLVFGSDPRCVLRRIHKFQMISFFLTSQTNVIVFAEKFQKNCLNQTFSMKDFSLGGLIYRV